MNKILTILIVALGATSCQKESRIEPDLSGHKLTIVSNGQGERIVLSGRDLDFVSIKPQSDTVVFENVESGSYFISVSRVRFPFEMAEKDTVLVLNIVNGN